jgi:Pyridoxamine 5'-phosphate oxidase
MSQKHLEISEKMEKFIVKQKLFFVGTATTDSRINISPKGMDSFRVINQNRVVWLNVTGSGNETSPHIQTNPRMTIMFIAFEGPPMILRLYGNAKVIHRNDHEWNELVSLFGEIPGARQIFDLYVDLVQTSCGMGVPYFDYVDERNQLNKWSDKIGEEGLKEYWKKSNQLSLDRQPTGIMDKNT